MFVLSSILYFNLSTMNKQDMLQEKMATGIFDPSLDPMISIKYKLNIFLRFVNSINVV